jgi:hypothetical protein
MNSKVFVSGALTGIADAETVKSNYEHIGRLCEQLGLEAYIPHLYTDPIANPDVPSREVYEVDSYHVRTAGLVIAYVGLPSLGVGQEIEIARQYGVPVVLVYERTHRVSRMTRGSPGVVAEIPYDSFDEVLSGIAAILQHLPSAQATAKAEGIPSQKRASSLVTACT